MKQEKREVGPSKGDWGIAAIAKARRPSFSTEDVSESRHRGANEKILTQSGVGQCHETVRVSHERLTESLTRFPATERRQRSGRSLCLGRTCTASTERTPFSQAFSTSRMAAGMLRQISCHFT